jgi:hypothetical protein
MSRGSRSVRSSRKPSLSCIKNTESKKLIWDGKVIFYGNKIKEVDTNLNNLSTSNVRLKITRQVQLKKSKTSFSRHLTTAQQKAKELGDKLNGYNSVQW